MTHDARQLTRILKGRWIRSYGVARCPAHNDRSPSLSLTNAADGRLLLFCHAGCSFNEVMTALGIIAASELPGGEVAPAEIARRRAEETARIQRRSRQARTLWNETMHVVGTCAETYLRGRGITCALPSTLRFAPACWHQNAERLTAMVALVEGAEGFGVHRTYLRTDGLGKANVTPSKAMLGVIKGGAVRLFKGTGTLVVAEGIETALSLNSGLLNGNPSVWATLSAGNMAALRLPDRPGLLVVATDGDDTGRSAGDNLAERASRQGWNVSMLPAPQNCDWNDILKAKGMGK